MTPITWMLGGIAIIALLMLMLGLEDAETSPHFCRVLFVFFAMSVIMFAICYTMGA